MSTFEVLVGAAPGFQLCIVQWPPGAPPPHGAVIAGVSARGDPLLAAVAEQYVAGNRSVYAGYASTRDGLVVVASDSGVQQLPWCVNGGVYLPPPAWRMTPYSSLSRFFGPSVSAPVSL